MPSQPPPSLPAIATAFGCKASDAMVRPPDKGCKICLSLEIIHNARDRVLLERGRGLSSLSDGDFHLHVVLKVKKFLDLA